MKKLSLICMLAFALTFAAGCNKQVTPTPTDQGAPAGQEAPAQDGGDDTANTEDPAEAAADEGDAAMVAFATCLTEAGVKMYGTEWCGHCKTQKGLFGDAFTDVDYTDCDADKKACLDAGVKGFPTWVDAEGNLYPGTQSLAKLGSLGGCELQG